MCFGHLYIFFVEMSVQVFPHFKIRFVCVFVDVALYILDINSFHVYNLHMFSSIL